VPQLEFAFPNQNAASSFLSAFVSGSRRHALHGGGPLGRFARQTAEMHGGRSHFSSHRKELISYQYQRTIFAQDRRYLYDRDETARMIVAKPAFDSWQVPPTIHNDQVEAYIEQEWYDHGFAQAAYACMVGQRRDGFGLIYVLTEDPNPHEPITPRSNIIGYQHVWLDDLAATKKPILPDVTADRQRYPHGIAAVELVVRSDKDGAVVDKFTADGSRFIMPPGDLTTRTWWHNPVLDPIYDDLWNLRDIVSAASKNTEQGNPIVVSVKTDDDLVKVLQEDDEDAIIEDLKKMVEGGTDYFGPLRAIEVKRLGKNEMEDISPITRLLASRIAHGDHPFTVNHILASSRGSEQVTDEDRIDYLSDLRAMQWTTVYPTLRRLVTLGHITNALPRRQHLVRRQIEWEFLRVLNPRERTFVDKSDAATVEAAHRAGRAVPPHIDRKFPVDPDAAYSDKGHRVDRMDDRFDPSLIPESQPANASPPIDLDARVRAIVEDLNEEKGILDQ
jgi:hypothetical protein